MANPQCFENAPTLNASSGEGYVQEFAGLNTYFTGSPDSNVAILLVSDIFGYEAPNLRKLADKVAAAGFLVVVPDFFHGDPMDMQKNRTDWRAAHGTDKGFEEAKPVISALKSKGVSAIGAAGFCWGGKVVVELAKSDEIQAVVLLHPSRVTVDDIKGFEAPNLRKLADRIAAAGYYVVVPEFMHGDPYDPDNAERPILVWMKDHGMDVGFEEAKPIVSAIKSKGFLTIGAVGFCWGGKVVVDLAKAGYIQAAVICHPPLVTVDDMKEVKAPIAVLGAEFDEHCPPELLRQYEGVLSVEGYVKIFPGVAHGWTVRYDTADKKAVEPAEEAHQDILDWFTKYVK